MRIISLLIICILPLSAVISAPTDTTSSGNHQTKTKLKPDSTASRKDNQSIKDTVFYESDKIDYDAEGKTLHLTGKAVVKYQKVTLQADTINYDINNSFFTATGFPVLIEENDTTIGDYMIYNIKTKRGHVRYASTHLDQGYFNGQRIVKTDKNELYVDQGDYTTCSNLESPHYYFYGNDIKVIPNDKIISRPVVLNIGDAPVALLPFFIFPIQRNRKSGFLTPTWGGHPTSGGYVDNIGYYFAPNDYMDFSLRGKVTEFKEFVVEGSSRYNLKYKLDGGISARYALTDDFLNSQQQWAIDYYHNQNLTPDGLTRLSGKGNLISTKDIITKFSEDTSELREQTLSANMTLSRTFPSINANSELSWSRTHNLEDNHISENIPSMSFSLPSRPLIPQQDNSGLTDPKWFNKIYYGSNINANVKHDKYDIDSSCFHPGAKLSIDLSAPQTIFKWFTISPQLSAGGSAFYGYMDTAVIGHDTLNDTVSDTLKSPFKDTKYQDYTLIHSDTLSRNQYGIPDSIRIQKVKSSVIAKHNEYPHKSAYVPYWNTGVSLSTNLYGFFPLHIFNLTGLRHTMTPSVSYSFVPEHKLDKKFYETGISYDGPHDRQQIININLSNQIDGKIQKDSAKTAGSKPSEEKFSILSFNLGTHYDFESKGRKWSDLSLNASTSYKSLHLSYSSSFWLYDQHDNLSLPLLNYLRLDVSVGTLTAKGKLWGGDLIELDSLHMKDSPKNQTGTGQDWYINVTPSYSFTLNRPGPTAMFTPDKSYSLSASAGINFTRNWSLSWSGVYNFVENQMVENSFRIGCDLECWDMRFEWRPEKLNPGYYFLINIKKLPEIKWEKQG